MAMNGKTISPRVGPGMKIISVYFDEKLHRKVKRMARKEDISMSQYFRKLAREDLEQAKGGQR